LRCAGRERKAVLAYLRELVRVAGHEVKHRSGLLQVLA
jgi:hypothetical protein